MIRFKRIILVSLQSVVVTAQAVGLSDTGHDTCYNDTASDSVTASNAASISGDAGSHPRQDCRYGRDAAAAAGVLTKSGAGTKGFDYTKIANNGTSLAAGTALGVAPTAWACTKDNITGLTWEVKTTTVTDLRYFDHTYSWYSSDSSTNGGSSGSPGNNTCNSTMAGNLCNTQAYVAAVNAGAGLCGQTDWRMPTRRELESLLNLANFSPTIEASYFPNTPLSFSWTGSAHNEASVAWFVDFYIGWVSSIGKTSAYPVRLVRGDYL